MTDEPQPAQTQKRFLLGLFIQSVVVNYLVLFSICTILDFIVSGSSNTIHDAILAVVATTFGMVLGYITIKKRGLEYFTITEPIPVETGEFCPWCGKDMEGVEFCPWCGKKP